MSKEKKDRQSVLNNGLSRKDFLKAGGLALAGTSLAGLNDYIGPALQPAAVSSDFESWDNEADFIIVGHGGAGAAAAITATLEDLGSFIVLEAAPESGEGGNTRVSGQIILIPDDVESAITYQSALNGPHAVDPDLQRDWATYLVENMEWFDDLDIVVLEAGAYSPEFPELPSAEHNHTYCVDGIHGKNSLWNALMEKRDEIGDYEVHYDTRAVELVRNPMTNEALGVIALKGANGFAEGPAPAGGERVSYKAKKGVILAMGGFENDLKMIRTYLGLSQSRYPIGTPYNRGDGFRMVAPFGPELWHMNNGVGLMLGVRAEGLDSPVSVSGSYGYSMLPLKSYIFLGPDGKRFMYEDTVYNARHGKKVTAGVYFDVPAPLGAWIIMDEMMFNNVPIASYGEQGTGWATVQRSFIAEDNQGFLNKGVIIKADTIEELANKTGMPLGGLTETFEKYDQYVANQFDPEFHRGQSVYDEFAGMGGDSSTQVEGVLREVIKPFDLQPLSPPYYATPLIGGFVNTQGGPKRNGNCQILQAIDGQPIPRLYGTGEFGAIYSYMYNGGGNVSEALATGRVAIRHASTLEAWDE